MLNCTKNTLKILESDYINNFVIVIVHTTGPRETNTLYWDEMSTWDPTCYNDGELLHQLTIALMIRAVSPSLHIYHCYICINTGQYNYIIEYLFVFDGLSWRSQILEKILGQKWSRFSLLFYIFYEFTKSILCLSYWTRNPLIKSPDGCCHGLLIKLYSMVFSFRIRMHAIYLWNQAEITGYSLTNGMECYRNIESWKKNTW